MSAFTRNLRESIKHGNCSFSMSLRAADIIDSQDDEIAMLKADISRLRQLTTTPPQPETADEREQD